MQDVQLIYISKVVRPLNRDELGHLADAAQLNNGMCDVSGALLYGHCSFLQVIEGPLYTISCLFQKIQRDQRHCEVSLLSFVPIRKRHFAGWDMEVLSLDHWREFDRAPLKHVVEAFESKSLRQLGDLGKQAALLVRAFENQIKKSPDQLDATR